MQNEEIVLLMAYIDKLKSRYQVKEFWKNQKFEFYEVIDLQTGKPIENRYSIYNIERFQENLGIPVDYGDQE